MAHIIAEHWDQQTESSQRLCFSLESKTLFLLWSSSCWQNRFHEVVLSRLRIGHMRLTHQHLLRGDESPLCNDCFVILTECPTHMIQRGRFFGSDGVLRPVTLRSILGDMRMRFWCRLGFCSAQAWLTVSNWITATTTDAWGWNPLYGPVLLCLCLTRSLTSIFACLFN